MSGYRVTLSMDGKPSRVGNAMTYQQADEICEDIYNALLEELGTRVSVYVEEDK